MTTTLGSQCLSCTHFRSPLDDPSAGERTCKAFAGAIPADVWENRADHRQRFTGDGGVRWSGSRFPEYVLRSRGYSHVSARNRVTAHTPGGHQHNQQAHAGDAVDLGAIALDGIEVYSPERIQEIYGEIRDEEGVRLSGDDGVYLTAKYFGNGDMHVSWDMPGGSSQVLEEMDPASMRQLADDIESVLDGFDYAEFNRDDLKPTDVVADADSDKHGFHIAADRDGDIRIDPEGGGTSESAFNISADQARAFVAALNNMADGYEENIGVVAASARRARRRPEVNGSGA